MTQQLVIKTGRGKGRSTQIIEVPSNEQLIAACIELRDRGDRKHISAGRYGNCIGAYYPPRPMTITEVNPITGEYGPTVPGDDIREMCVFWYENVRAIADTYFESDPPTLHYYCKRAIDPEPSLFDFTLKEEGQPLQVTLTKYERDPALRRSCIAIHGSRCNVCDIDFEEQYGSLMAGFVHVHHLEPLGERAEAHLVDPARDLIPVCPNCHNVIHARRPPFSPNEVRAMLRGRNPSGPPQAAVLAEDPAPPIFPRP